MTPPGALDQYIADVALVVAVEFAVVVTTTKRAVVVASSSGDHEHVAVDAETVYTFLPRILVSVCCRWVTEPLNPLLMPLPVILSLHLEHRIGLSITVLV